MNSGSSGSGTAATAAPLIRKGRRCIERTTVSPPDGEGTELWKLMKYMYGSSPTTSKLGLGEAGSMSDG